MAHKLIVRTSNIVTSEDDSYVAHAANPDVAAEIVRRWNAFEAMGEALNLAYKNAQSRLYVMPLNAPESDKAAIQTEISVYKTALAAYLPADQRQDMRGQNVDETV